MNSPKFSNAVINCLVEVYNNAIPKADFMKLIDDAEIEPDGRKKIPFDDYVIDDMLFKDIIEKHIKQSKIPKYLKESFRLNLYLGPSPRSVKNENI